MQRALISQAIILLSIPLALACGENKSKTYTSKTESSPAESNAEAKPTQAEQKSQDPNAQKAAVRKDAENKAEVQQVQKIIQDCVEKKLKLHDEGAEDGEFVEDEDLHLADNGTVKPSPVPCVAKPASPVPSAKPAPSASPVAKPSPSPSSGPLALDGAALYQKACANCHMPKATTNIKNKTAQGTIDAIANVSVMKAIVLSKAEADAISAYLSAP